MPEHTFNPAIVAPTFNNAATLPAIIERLRLLNVPLFVVNDGSTDGTGAFLADYSARAENSGVTVITHERNQGKASAMQSGFAAAHLAGFTHAITIDTDGQLDPEQIPQLIAKAKEQPTALVIGVRDDHKSDYPSRSRFGRRFSNNLVRLESGVRVNDSQCGLRAYPLGLVRAVKCQAQRFGYETEIITRAGWAGCPVAEVPVNCRYLPEGQRVSHFRPYVDSARAVLMHGRLLVRTLAPWPHTRWPGAARAAWPTWKSLKEWISLKDAWHQLRHDESSHTMFATGLALGVFVANLPVYGGQTVLALYAAKRLHLHPAPVIIGTQASMPPISFVLIAMAIYLGHMLLHGTWPISPADGWSFKAIWQLAPSLFASWALGSVIVGAVLAALTFALSSIFFRFALIRQPVAEPAKAD